MATRPKQGKRFGMEKGIQRNKEEELGQKRPNRSSGQSNANERVPSLREDVGSSQMRDIERMGRGINPQAAEVSKKGKPLSPNIQEQQRFTQRKAGSRALARTISRGTLVGAAAGAGYEVGSQIGAYVEKKAEEERGANLENVVNRGKFESLMDRPVAAPKKAAKSVSMSDMPKAAPAPKAKAAASPAPKMQERGVREGPNENISEDTRSRAMASVAELEDVNKKNKWKGVME